MFGSIVVRLFSLDQCGTSIAAVRNMRVFGVDDAKCQQEWACGTSCMVERSGGRGIGWNCGLDRQPSAIVSSHSIGLESAIANALEIVCGQRRHKPNCCITRLRLWESSDRSYWATRGVR